LVSVAIPPVFVERECLERAIGCRTRASASSRVCAHASSNGTSRRAGGFIDVDSDLGQGATFTLALPARWTDTRSSG
jgi:hypothetical protein